MDSKYKYTYERTADYCYKGTDVLINKLNITNDKDLYHESINGDYKKLKDMFKKNSKIISEEERLEYINIYCSNDLKKVIEN